MQALSIDTTRVNIARWEKSRAKSHRSSKSMDYLAKNKPAIQQALQAITDSGKANVLEQLSTAQPIMFHSKLEVLLGSLRRWKILPEWQEAIVADIRTLRSNNPRLGKSALSIQV